MPFLSRSLSFLKRKEKYEPMSTDSDFFSTPKASVKDVNMIPEELDSQVVRANGRNKKSMVKETLVNLGQKMKFTKGKGKGSLYKGLSPCTPQRRSARLTAKHSPLDVRLYSPFCIQTPTQSSSSRRGIQNQELRRSARNSAKKAPPVGKENIDPKATVTKHLGHYKQLAGQFNLTYENDCTMSP